MTGITDQVEDVHDVKKVVRREKWTRTENVRQVQEEIERRHPSHNLLRMSVIGEQSLYNN